MLFMQTTMVVGFVDLRTSLVERMENRKKLNVRKLEDACFTYQLVHFFEQHSQLEDMNFGSGSTPGNRRDIEHLCERACISRSKATPNWISHAICSSGV